MVHWRMQPFILVSDNERSANLKSRLFQLSTGLDNDEGLRSGMYSDQLAFEDDVWKIWSLNVDQFYYAFWIGKRGGMSLMF